MIVNTRKHSYYVSGEDLSMIEAGSTIFDTEKNKFYIFLAPGVMTEMDAEEIPEEVEEESVVEPIEPDNEVTENPSETTEPEENLDEPKTPEEELDNLEE